MDNLSLLIYCKDEYEKVYSIINSFEDFVEDFVVVITGSRQSFLYKGSNDRIKIVRVKWEDDFSKPLNIGIKNCSKEWIFRIDADEEIDNKNIERIKKAIQFGNENDLYGFEASIINYIPNEFNDIDAQRVNFYKGYDKALETKCIRLFRNDKRIFYEYNIGQQIYYTINRSSLKWIQSNIEIHHWGYLEIEKKADYYIKLYNTKIKENPKEISGYLRLGKLYDIKNDFKKANEVYKEGYDNLQSEDCLLCYLLNNKKIEQDS